MVVGQSPSTSGLQERGDRRSRSWRFLSLASTKAEEEEGSVGDAWQEVGETPAGGLSPLWASGPALASKGAKGPQGRMGGLGLVLSMFKHSA